MTLLTLRDSVLATLAYFDLFSAPMSGEDLFRSLWSPKRPVSFAELERVLSELNNEKKIEEQNGVWFLPGRSALMSAYTEQVKCSEEKIRRAQKAARALAWIPFFRAMFVCNTVGMRVARRESDIDVFIVIKEKRLWLTRFLITITLTLCGMRRTKTRVANQICLSFFVTDDALNLSSLTLGVPDVYLMYWLDTLIPVYDPDHLHRVLMSENTFAKAYIPHGFGRPRQEKEVEVGRVGKRLKWFFERAWAGAYGALLEAQAKTIQMSKMKMNKKSVQDAHDTRVVETDQVLKFHEHDRRAEYRESWVARCRSLGVIPYDVS